MEGGFWSGKQTESPGMSKMRGGLVSSVLVGDVSVGDVLVGDLRARSVLRSWPTETRAMRPASNSRPVARFRTTRCGSAFGIAHSAAAASGRATKTLARVAGSSSCSSVQPARTSTHLHGSCVPTHSYVSECATGAGSGAFARMLLLRCGSDDFSCLSSGTIPDGVSWFSTGSSESLSSGSKYADGGANDAVRFGMMLDEVLSLDPIVVVVVVS